MSNGSRKARNVAALGGGALIAAPFVATGTAEAGNTYTVSNKNDSGAGSLRQAIEDANLHSGADTIMFTAAARGTITLASDLPKVQDSVDIQGPGAALLTVDGGGHRLFYVYDEYSTIDVTISGVRLTGGEHPAIGGAVLVLGEHLTLDHVVISGNTSPGGGGVGATAYSYADFDDLTLTVIDCTISGNSATAGGGIYVYDLPDGDETTVVIENTTISGNTATEFGGGLTIMMAGSPVRVVNSTISGNAAPIGGGLVAGDPESLVVLEHSTVTANEARSIGPAGAGVTPTGGPSASGGEIGGGIGSAGHVELDHSVVSGNLAPVDPDVYLIGDVADALTGSYSMVGDLDGVTLGGTTNLPEGDAKLGTLADNGGPTLTHMPQTGSPLIDAGDPAFAAPPSTDQRGLPRVAGDHVDIGAVESGSAALPPTGGSSGLMTALGAALLAVGGVLHLTGRRSRRA